MKYRIIEAYNGFYIVQKRFLLWKPAQLIRKISPTYGVYDYYTINYKTLEEAITQLEIFRKEKDDTIIRYYDIKS